MLSDELIELARRKHPDWKEHPNEKKPRATYELNKQVRGSEGRLIIYQYIFKRREIKIAVYLTRLGKERVTACDRLTRETASIEKECGLTSTWDFNKEGEKIRFSLSAWKTDSELVKHGADDQVVAFLVDTMWRFQEATRPLIKL